MADFDLNEYQTLAARTLDRPGERALNMAALGLAGEAGEVVDLIKKHIYHGHPMDLAKLVAELGDVLWYVATLATALDIKLSDVAEGNIEKLMARYPEGFSSERSRNRVDS